MHDRKYWCRLSPVTHICHTIVSTTRYTHLRYRGRVALADFPRRSLFVVTLAQLSPDDVGRYRCGIGNTNNMFFFSMNLTVSAGTRSRLAGQVRWRECREGAGAGDTARVQEGFAPAPRGGGDEEKLGVRQDL